MFDIGDYVLHKKTGKLGKVFGYGHQIVRGTYESTLKVMLVEQTTIKSFVEDLSNEWLLWQKDTIPQLPLQNQFTSLLANVN